MLRPRTAGGTQKYARAKIPDQAIFRVALLKCVPSFPGSSVESVGKFGLGKLAKGVVEGEFGYPEGPKAIRFSHGDFGFVIQALHNPAGKHFLGLEVVENQPPVGA